MVSLLAPAGPTAVLPPSSAVAAPAPTPAAKGVTLKPALKRVLRRVNRARARHDLRPVRAQRCLTRRFAQPWARHMADTGDFAHQDIARIFDVCTRFTRVGENIAAGQPTAKAVMRAWMHSAGHRRNILSPSFTRIGLGLKRDSSGVRYWVQDFGG